MVESTRRKLKIVKIVLWSILCAILLFVLVVVGSLLVDKYVKKSKVPMFAGYGSMIVLTGSMYPAIEAGDLIIVKKCDEYKISDDIVTYIRSDGEIITHRLTRYFQEEGKYEVWGDANPDPDAEHISIDQIAGKVVLTIPKIGLVFDWILKDGGIIYIIALIAVLVAAVYFWGLTKPEAEAAKDAEGAGDGATPDISSEANTDNTAAPSEVATNDSTAAPATDTESTAATPEEAVEPQQDPQNDSKQ